MRISNDELFQGVLKAINSVRWRDCEEDDSYEWYYAEDMLYVIRLKLVNAYWFIKAKSPSKAFEIIKGRITNSK